MANGNFLPLDSTQLVFSASAGRFSGNSLWLDPGFKDDKVNVKVVLKEDPAISRQFDIYIKKNPDNEKLKTVDEIIDNMRSGKKTKKKGSR